ncbi:MAG: hypothetical protein ACJA1A_003161 [Saprospiraceae bacterium]|jgi:hypothetical protein|tara:strand:- start:896 stop:1648 length:753 start_codon:yes stop_codon:yes gene_type:complete
MKRTLFILFAVISLSSCKTKKASTVVAPQNKGESIIQQAIEAHGGKKYETAHYSFTFRKKQYTFRNNGNQYEYSVIGKKDGKTTKDVMDNDGMTRQIDGQSIPLTKDEQYRFSQGVNSVIYFATLPHKLKDKSVNKNHIGKTSIKGKNYEVVQVTFDEAGGGKDHDDQYHYWINTETHLIDYLAYNYTVNKGGVRFRSAYNTRRIDGIIFQDYINFKATVGTPLIDLPKLYEADQLEQLSLIETGNVVKL